MRRRICSTTKKRGGGRIAWHRFSACRLPTSSCRSVAATACKKWVS
ncbi:MAG: DUF1187 family protein [Bythopirellula sp.]